MKEVARVYVQSLNYSIDAISGGARRVVRIEGEIADENDGSLSGLMTMRGPLILCLDEDAKSERSFREIAIDAVAMLAKSKEVLESIKSSLDMDGLSEAERLELIGALMKGWGDAVD